MRQAFRSNEIEITTWTSNGHLILYFQNRMLKFYIKVCLSNLHPRLGGIFDIPTFSFLGLSITHVCLKVNSYRIFRRLSLCMYLFSLQCFQEHFLLLSFQSFDQNQAEARIGNQCFCRRCNIFGWICVYWQCYALTFTLHWKSH